MREDDAEDGHHAAGAVDGRGGWLTTYLSFLAAEFGDKTMLAALRGG